MPRIRVLVSTKYTQGDRSNDFCFTDDAELVDLSNVCGSDTGDPDTSCGCARAFTGLTSSKGTTTAEVALRELTPTQHRDAIHASYLASGLPNTPDLRRDAVAAADELRRVARQFPVGTVIERRGTLRVRWWACPLSQTR